MMLFAVTRRAGTVDWADEEEILGFAREMRAALGVLHDHAESEATFLHPVLARWLPDRVAGLSGEHEVLHAELVRLEGALTRAVAHAPGRARLAIGLAFYRS